jgi:hypothetical protein
MGKAAGAASGLDQSESGFASIAPGKRDAVGTEQLAVSLVAGLLRNCPHLQVLVTSRMRLELAEE